VTWLTFDDEQSRSLLAGEQVQHLRWAGSRDYANTVRNTGTAVGRLRSGTYDTVISTGAAAALSVLPLAHLRGLPCHYIESATRTEHPSLTGRLLAAIPGVHCYTQYASWSGSRWAYGGSVFDGYAPTAPQPVVLRKVVVTLGTMRQWSFRSAVERLLQVLPREAEVVWQTGHTDVSGLPMVAQPLLSSDALTRHMREADLVVAHAGVGSALDALEAGHRPLLLPRRASRGEHVDDHQVAVTSELVGRDLAVTAEAPDLMPHHLEQAAARRVRRVSPPDFLLARPRGG
jgi:UDP-N-acetylglucosamine transferase subunit ALG13